MERRRAAARQRKKRGGTPATEETGGKSGLSRAQSGAMNAAERDIGVARISFGSLAAFASRRDGPSQGSRALVAGLAFAALGVVGGAAAIAGSCRVLVAIGSVDMEPSPAGMSLRLSGSWEFDNLVQVASGLSFNVLLVREDNYLRFHYPDQVFTGYVPGLGARVDSGLDGNDLLSVEASGAMEPAARFVNFEAQRMKLASPVPAGEGPISVVAYLVLDDDYVSPIISNTITRPLEVAPPVDKVDEGGIVTEPGGDGTTTPAPDPSTELAP